MWAVFVKWFLGVGGWKWFAGAAVLALIAASYAYAHHEGVKSGTASEHAKTMQVQAGWDAYKAQIAANAAKVTADSLAEQKRLQAALDASQAELLKTQGLANAISQALKDYLASAAKGDERPIGPAAAEYYSRVRREAAGGSAGPGSP